MILTDLEIEALIALEKKLKGRKAKRLEKRGHWQQNFDVEGANGEIFVISKRQNNLRSDDFSVIVEYQLTNGKRFTLRRYNGRHYHPNRIEGSNTGFNFHIHYATERYQLAGKSEVGFAIETPNYTTLSGAFELMLRELNIIQIDNSGQLQFSL
jgi:hypothetical protein